MNQPPENLVVGTDNQVNGPVYGLVVQAGTITEGVHIHPPAGGPIVTLPHRWGTVPPRATGFQTRSTTERLARSLERGDPAALASNSAAHTCLVAGMGGVGKTQIAVDYAERLWSAGDVALLVWVAAGSRDAIVSSYAEVAIDVTGIADPDRERGARRFLELLATMPGLWLVVLDDVQNPADLRGLWPPITATGRTVVTTRRRDSALRGHGRTLLEVDVFTPDEARAYLHTVLADHPHLRLGVKQLAATLGYLPLAVAQATAYLMDRNLSCAGYLTRWVDRRRNLAALVPEPDELPDEHRATMAVTWSLSVEQANHLEPTGVAQPLLEVASVLDANGIPEDLFTAPTVVDFVAAAVGQGADADQARDGLGCLHRTSLITLDPDSSARAVRVHALVQRATRDAMPADRLAAVACAAADGLLRVWPDVERDTALGEVLRANVAALAETAGKHLWTSGAHVVLYRAGTSLGEAGLLAEAHLHFQRVHDIAVDHLGPDHPDTLTTRHNIAFWRGQSGDRAGAVTAFEQLLMDRLRILGSSHPDTLTTRHNLARWRGDSGDPATAVTALEDLLPDQLRILGPDHPDTLTTRHNIAYYRGESGDLAGVVTALEQLLTDELRVLGPNHPSTLTTRHNLARSRGESGDPVGAVAAFKQLLTDELRVLGPNHPNTLTTRYNLARSHGESGDPANAVTALEDLLPDQLRILGPDHPDTLTTRHNIAFWQNQLGGRSS